MAAIILAPLHIFNFLFPIPKYIRGKKRRVSLWHQDRNLECPKTRSLPSWDLHIPWRAPGPVSGGGGVMRLSDIIKDMATVHMTESEVTHNFAAVLEKIPTGVEVVVEQDHRPVAVIRSPVRSGRPI